MTHEKLCQTEHNQPCKSCGGSVNVAKHIAKHGFMKLNEAFYLIWQAKVDKSIRELYAVVELYIQ
jgi:hypothetical protein